MYKALLLDLDNTLLDIDFQGFMEEYVQRVARRFADRVPPERFAQQLIESTRAMILNDRAGRTVLQAFVDDFFPKLELPVRYMDRFMDFYREEFRELRRWARPMPFARQFIETALSRSLRVVIATAPLFPLEAIQERMRWADVADLEFAFITTADNMHFSKPSPRYYLEIAESIELRPEECLMIGDEELMDGAAAAAGMRVELVGPNRPSNMSHWFADSFPPGAGNAFERHESLEALATQLIFEGVF